MNDALCLHNFFSLSNICPLDVALCETAEDRLFEANAGYDCTGEQNKAFLILLC